MIKAFLDCHKGGEKMNEIKPIETYYKGYRFRSRAEARWAVFFDACNVEWEYEAEGYDLGNGLYYLPDFLVHNIVINPYSKPKKKADLYVEVKGFLTEKDAEKIRHFSIEEVFDVRGDCGGYWDKIRNPLFLVGSKIPENFIDTFSEAERLRENSFHDISFYSLNTVDLSWGEKASFAIDKSGDLMLLEKNYNYKILVFEDNTWKEVILDTIKQIEGKPWKQVIELDTNKVSKRKTNKAYQMARSARF